MRAPPYAYPQAEVQQGAYLREKGEDGRRLYWVAGAVEDAVLLEDCAAPHELEWWPVNAVLDKLTVVHPRK